MSRRCPLYPQKRTSRRVIGMSALCQKRTSIKRRGQGDARSHSGEDQPFSPVHYDGLTLGGDRDRRAIRRSSARRAGIRKTNRAAEMPSMTTALEQRAASRVAPIGLLSLVTASVGWGLNWPVMKFVFSEWPPLSARGWAGVIGAAALALYAVATGVSLKVPADQWPRLIISAILNIALWVAVMSYGLLWLPASEAVVIAYTMPVWTALLAWPLLGERLTLLRVTALVMAFAGLASLFGAGGMSANMAKLPGVLLALTGSVGFAVGTIFLKRYPIQLPGATSATWQIAIGSVPIALAGTLLEHPHIAALSSAGWFALGYMILVGHCIAYVTWFGAVERLPASVAAIGTTLVPVIGVIVSAIALHEPLGLSQIAALVFTVVGVALAARS